MILAPAPFNLTYLPFMPFWLCKTRTETQKRINKNIVYVIYFPLSILFGITYFSANLLMALPAYFYALAHKMKILCNVQDSKDKSKKITDFFMFLFFGPFLLSVAQITDLITFYRHLYKW
jgi:hypothetical protein